MNKIRKILNPSFFLPYIREKFAPTVALNPNKGYTFSDLFIAMMTIGLQNMIIFLMQN